jgi:hypothetical protein
MRVALVDVDTFICVATAGQAVAVMAIIRRTGEVGATLADDTFKVPIT